MSCNNPIKHIEALVTPDNVKSIYWRVNKDVLKDGYDVQFNIYVADDSLGPWEKINTTPLINTCVFIDKDKHRYSKVSDVWYSVSMTLVNHVDPIDTIDRGYSKPTQIQGSLTDKGFLIAKAMLKGLYQRMKKGGGSQGFLLKKKTFGDRCPECTDFDTEAVVNYHCHLCFGTGYVGGYHEGIEFWLLPNPVQLRERKEEQTGYTQGVAFSATCAAYPWIDSGDVWVDAKTNERFVIMQIANTKEIERKPVILQLALTKASNTDITMDIPVTTVDAKFLNEIAGVTYELTDTFPTTNKSIIKAEDAADDKGWRRGLQGDDF